MTIDESKLSPMMKQYLEVKRQYQDDIVFYRLGDFYEMFFDDAQTVSRELELTLTGRDCGLEQRAPMCGVPHHSSEVYIKRLIDKGYRVVICEQTSDPAQSKGLVTREVVRIVTPGTVTESSMLDEARNNYLCMLYISDDGYSLSAADVSTGTLTTLAKKCRNLSAEMITDLSRYTPSEILFNERMFAYTEVCNYIKDKLHSITQVVKQEELNCDKMAGVVLRATGCQSLSDCDLADKPDCVVSLGILLQYIAETQRAVNVHFAGIDVYEREQFMALDLTARRNLELVETMRSKEKKGSLLWVLDQTKTAMGKRLLRTYVEQPLVNCALLTKRLNAVEELVQNPILLGSLTDALGGIYDMERLMTRVMYGSANPRELKALGQTFRRLPPLKQVTEQLNAGMLKELCRNLETLEDACELLDRAIVDDPPIQVREGGIIKTGYNEQLDEIRTLLTGSKDVIAQMETQEKERTGIRGLKIGYNRVFGYYIEVTKSNLELVPDTYIRKQTLANCERYITEELKELEGRILTASDRIQSLEYELFTEVRRFIADKYDGIIKTSQAVAALDVLASFANVALQNNYCKPHITAKGTIEIKNGRHPVVEKMLRDDVFVPNDTYLDTSESRLSIITGPNMSGKSTYMRQVAIITIMAQIGSFVPASSATIGIVDKIFTRVGASDDLAAGQSTFMLEMTEVADILKNATPNSLVILDEIGRGTSTFDGMSIAKAVVEHIVNTRSLGCKTLFATHYHELTCLEDELKGVNNFSVAVKRRGEDIIFLRKIVKGAADESYGIEVARLAGVPQKVTHRAAEILRQLEQQGGQLSPREKPAEPASQVSFGNLNHEEIIHRLEQVDINSMSPMDCMNLVHDLTKLL